MSAQQVQRLQTLLATVQRNRQRPGEPMGTAAANVVQNKAPANQASQANQAAAAEPSRPRISAPEPKPAPAPQVAQPARPAAAAKPAAPMPAQPPSQPKVPLRPEPQAAPAHVAQAQEPIVPRTIEPDVVRPATRPIAQLVSKHAPVVDATFGAMLKRSLSLRPN